MRINLHHALHIHHVMRAHMHPVRRDQCKQAPVCWQSKSIMHFVYPPHLECSRMRFVPTSANGGLAANCPATCITCAIMSARLSKQRETRPIAAASGPLTLRAVSAMSAAAPAAMQCKLVNTSSRDSLLTTLSYLHACVPAMHVERTGYTVQSTCGSTRAASFSLRCMCCTKKCTPTPQLTQTQGQRGSLYVVLLS